jgi:hypothetical protein
MAAQLVASRVVLSSTELVSWLVIILTSDKTVSNTIPKVTPYEEGNTADHQ